MIDLAGIVDYERTFPHPLRAYPKGSPEGVDVGITLHIRHVDCEAATEAKKDGDEAMYAACIAGWDGDLSLDGKALTYSPENALRLIQHPRCKWVQAQVRRAALDIGNFTTI